MGLTQLKEMKVDAVDKLVSDKTNQDAYDGLMTKTTPAIDAVVQQLNDMETKTMVLNLPST